MKRLSIYLILVLLSATSFSMPSYSEEGEAERPRVAVLAFSSHNCPKNLSSAAEAMIGSKLFEARIFNMVERGQINQIFKELELQQTGCTDSDCLVKVGKLLTANKIITGSIHKIDDYTIVIKVIDVASGKIEANFKETASSEGNFPNAISEIAHRITGEYKTRVYWGINVTGAYLYPMGDLAELTSGGYGANVDINLYNFPFRNSIIRLTSGYYTFKGKEDAINSIMMVPLGAYLGYSLSITRNISINPFIGGGYLLNQMKYDKDGSDLAGNYEYKSEMFNDSFVAAKLEIGIKLFGMFSVVVAPSYTYIFEKDTSNQLIGGNVGFELTF